MGLGVVLGVAVAGVKGDWSRGVGGGHADDGGDLEGVGGIGGLDHGVGGGQLQGVGDGGAGGQVEVVVAELHRVSHGGVRGLSVGLGGHVVVDGGPAGLVGGPLQGVVLPDQLFVPAIGDAVRGLDGRAYEVWGAARGIGMVERPAVGFIADDAELEAHRVRRRAGAARA